MKTWKHWVVVDRVRMADGKVREVRTKVKARSESEVLDKIEGRVPEVDGYLVDEVLSTEVEGQR
jgi:hypothetical protein